MYDIVVLGEYFFDQIFIGMPHFPKLGCETFCQDIISTGGGLYTTVVTLRRLGVRVGWPALFGKDYYSRFVYDLAQAEGVDLSLVKHLDRPYRRVTTSLPYNGERAFVTYVDGEDPVEQRAHWLATMQTHDFRHVHIGGLMPPDELRPLLQPARAHGATVSIDCQDVPLLEKPCNCREALTMVDIFMPNARELMLVAETDTVDSALRKLMSLCALIVVKDGANGCWIGHQGEITHVPGMCAGACVDTTGAGDCFNGGFLYGYVVERAPLDVCGRYGNICGGLSVTGRGGATAAPTRDTLLSWCTTPEPVVPPGD